MPKPPLPPPALLHLLRFHSLGLLVRLRGGDVTGQRRVVVIPQLVELGGLVLAAAGGAAVPETGQGGTQFGTFGGHGALDGLAELERKGSERREVRIEDRLKLCESEACLSLLGSLHRAYKTIVWLMKDLAALHVVERKCRTIITSLSP